MNYKKIFMESLPVEERDAWAKQKAAMDWEAANHMSILKDKARQIRNGKQGEKSLNTAIEILNAFEIPASIDKVYDDNGYKVISLANDVLFALTDGRYVWCGAPIDEYDDNKPAMTEDDYVYGVYDVFEEYFGDPSASDRNFEFSKEGDQLRLTVIADRGLAGKIYGVCHKNDLIVDKEGPYDDGTYDVEVLFTDDLNCWENFRKVAPELYKLLPFDVGSSFTK